MSKDCVVSFGGGVGGKNDGAILESNGAIGGKNDGAVLESNSAVLESSSTFLESNHAKKFVPFITAGVPDLETTREILLSMAANGADIIEVGIPFSDPVAEGKVIESANEIALKNGVTTDGVFEMLASLGADCHAESCADSSAKSCADSKKSADSKNAAFPAKLAIMTYANVVFGYGSDKFLKKAASIGVKYLILPDVPFEEKDEFLGACKQNGVTLVSFIAPTSSNERIEKIAKNAKGFIYLVSSLGVTGARENIATDLESIISKIRAHTATPIFVGFGIKDETMAKKIASIADGIIIGSAIVRMVLESTPAESKADSTESTAKIIQKIANFCAKIRAAIDS